MIRARGYDKYQAHRDWQRLGNDHWWMWEDDKMSEKSWKADGRIHQVKKELASSLVNWFDICTDVNPGLSIPQRYGVITRIGTTELLTTRTRWWLWAMWTGDVFFFWIAPREGSQSLRASSSALDCLLYSVYSTGGELSKSSDVTWTAEMLSLFVRLGHINTDLAKAKKIKSVLEPRYIERSLSLKLRQTASYVRYRKENTRSH